MTEKWSHRPVIGYSDRETVMLDFDYMPFKSVSYWALRTLEWFKLQGFLILKSSKNCYHVIFDRAVSWTENMRIVAWVCLQSRHRALRKWFLLQCIKEWSTLRVSPKNGKPSPRIVFRYGKQDAQIREFLHYRRVIKSIVKRLTAMIGRDTSGL